MAPDRQPDRTVQASDLVLGQVEMYGQPLLAALAIHARPQCSDVEGWRLKGFKQRHVVELGIVCGGDDGGVRVEPELDGDVVRHSCQERCARDTPLFGILRPRVAHEHRVAEGLAYRRKISRNLPCANDEQAPARPVEGRQALAVEGKRLRARGLQSN